MGWDATESTRKGMRDPINPTIPESAAADGGRGGSSTAVLVSTGGGTLLVVIAAGAFAGVTLAATSTRVLTAVSG